MWPTLLFLSFVALWGFFEVWDRRETARFKASELDQAAECWRRAAYDFENGTPYYLAKADRDSDEAKKLRRKWWL